MPQPGGPAAHLPADLVECCRRSGIRSEPHLLWVRISRQELVWLRRLPGQPPGLRFPRFGLWKRHVISTSRFGIGQDRGSNKTPLGLHRVAAKVGGGWPAGAVFSSRQPVGYTWQGRPTAAIVHRILWLEGLEPGVNRGGQVDSFNRYIYIHGCSDETTLGRPASSGCIHLAAGDLIPLWEALPIGTLVWISA